MGLTTTLDSSFYLKLYNGAHEKNQQYFVTKDIAVVIKTIYVNYIPDTSFCGAI